MEKRKTLLVVALLLLICISVGIYFLFIKDSNTEEEDIDNTDIISDELEEEEIVHNMRLSITGPEEDIISSGQARMYNGFVQGNGKYSNLVKCNWKFYLNENNEEYLYKEQDNGGVLSSESQDICSFTSTFIDKVGKLRVVLSMTVYDNINENIETVTTEREYVVQ